MACIGDGEEGRKEGRVKAERTEVGTCHVGLAKLAPTLALGTFIILIDHKACLGASFLKAT